MGCRANPFQSVFLGSEDMTNLQLPLLTQFANSPITYDALQATDKEKLSECKVLGVLLLIITMAALKQQ